MQQRPAMMSVPQFGGWDQKAPGATDYSMVFTQARANKKQQKTNLTEIKHRSLGNERDIANAKHGKAHHHHHVHGHSHAHEEPLVMVRPFSLVLIAVTKLCILGVIRLT